MESLDVLRSELEILQPQVLAADAEILAALEVKETAVIAYEEAKTAVRALKAVRDPLREQEMQIQRIIGTLDGPPEQVLSNGGE